MASFEWDSAKERHNIAKHGVSFNDAQKAFKDPHRKIFTDEKHGTYEERFFCVGMVDGNIMTVRFTYRKEVIRIIGAGYWRKGRIYYEE